MNVNVFAGSIVAAAAVVSFAQADVTQVNFAGVAYGEFVSIVSPGHNGAIFAGQLLISLSGSTGSSGYLDGNYISYCADVYQGAGSGQYDIVPVSALPTSAPMGAAAAQGIVDLYDFAGGAQYGTDAAFACAFQLAIWEVANDFGALDINLGNFQATGMSAQAGIYLNLLLSAVGSNGSANLVGLSNDQLQDYIIEVPAPGALALLGAAGFAGSRRRRA